MEAKKWAFRPIWLHPSRCDISERGYPALCRRVTDTGAACGEEPKIDDTRGKDSRGEARAYPWENDSLTVYVQPIVDLRTGRVFGHEVLVRGPKGSSWSADALWRAATARGAVTKLEAACRRAAFGLKHAPTPWPGLLFVNVHPELPADATDCWPPRPDEVLLEISEGRLLTENPQVQRTIKEFRNRGFRIVLDDFGSGCSNFNALLEVAPDGLKLDRRLVAGSHGDPRRQTILGLIAETCARLGVMLVAEGIEHAQELETLRRLGIPYGQGLLLGRIKPVAMLRRPRAVDDGGEQ